MHDCAYFEEMLALSVDGCLPESEEAELQQHLDNCPACRAAHDAYNAIHESLKDTTISAPSDFTSSVMAQVRKEKRRKHNRNISVAFTAAAALLIVAIGLPSLRYSSRSEAPMDAPMNFSIFSDTGGMDENSGNAEPESAAADMARENIMPGGMAKQAVTGPIQENGDVYLLPDDTDAEAAKNSAAGAVPAATAAAEDAAVTMMPEEALTEDAAAEEDAARAKPAHVPHIRGYSRAE